MVDEKQKSSKFDKILSVIGIILCILLVPILIVNCTLLVKGLVNPEDVPSIGGIFPMIVQSNSMHPEFSTGALIICKEIEAEDVKVGDVITFYDPESSQNSVVTHRVLEIGSDANGITFLTKGDFNNTQDNVPIPEAKLIGIYTGVSIGGAGDVAMFMQTTPGLIVCVALPVALLVAYDYGRRKMYEKKHAQDKDALMAELEELRKLRAESAARKAEEQA